MKWIGQYIVDLIARFRNLTYFENGVNITGDITATSDTVTFQSANADDPTVIIKNTANDNQAARLAFWKDRLVDMVDHDRVGEIDFYGYDDGTPSLQQYGKIMVQALDSGSGSEKGKMRLQVAEFDGTIGTDGLVLEGQAADGEIDVTIAAGVGSTTTVAGDLVVNGDSVLFESSDSYEPLVQIKNTNSDIRSAELRFVKDKGAAGEDGDELGLIKFYGDNEAQQQTYFGHIKGAIATAADGTEGGAIEIAVATHDGELQNGLVITDGNLEDEIDVTIGNTLTSVTTLAGELTVGGSTSAMNNAGLVMVANQSRITGLGTITSGTWQGGVIDSAYLDADTAHYSLSRQFTHHMMTDNIGTDTKVYIALQESDAESGTATNKNLPFLVPAAGKLLKVLCRVGSASTDLSGVTFTWTLETTNTSTNTGAAPSVIGTQSGAGPTGQTMTTYDFTSSLDSGTNAVSAGDTVMLGISADDTTGNFKWYVTCVWEFDLS